jgi:hypothetical protein
MNNDPGVPTISFHVYLKFGRCTIHGQLGYRVKKWAACFPSTEGSKIPVQQGKICERKHLTLLERPIGIFMNNYYLPALEKYAYHIHHVRILSKDFCGKERFIAFKKRPGDVNTRRDYAERLSAKFNLEIQSDHFGNGRSLSMEGSSVEFFSAPAIVNAEANPTGDYSGSITMESQSHFSDESKQDASTTHAHMLVLLEYLFENNVMKIGSTEWQNTDGCGKQYRCGTALYLLSLLASQKHVVIGRAIGAPGHGKDIVDKLALFLQMTQTPMVIMLLNVHQSRAHYRKPSLL